ncbi:CIR protein [Plasmodium chabaudi chabaudi]|uniref:CIR protein n=1 Tax=Plasmodium chabaudi chabaudi TaxID=31271 RepID=A0A4V0K4N1_PLACU|nr:CIR protein [Plasmodium chabaudi chabaudi]VTZ67882.1 CIR protein [Plasmodium chabaudi chabaudi]|eukprot:XP_016653511.1 CIR protein [Plasmodium chabaudi chabaudi]
MASAVCNAIKAIDNFIVVKEGNIGVNISFKEILNPYCTVKSLVNKEECQSYNEMVSSAFILLLKFLNLVDVYDGDLTNDRLAEYAILWLSYKLNQNPQKGINTLNDFYTRNIGKNTHYTSTTDDIDVYKSYKDFIDKNNDLMTVNIKEISQFYAPFKSLCGMYIECNGKKTNHTKCLEKANEFVENFEKLNGNSDITGNSSYRHILYTLSADYNSLKSDCAEKCTDCKDIPILSEIKTPPFSSITSKLISVLLIFVAIPISLGIAYKYSLFGFDKRLHRQYLREKLKKIKKKMNHYI